jgi:methionyl-tRNA synthetase
MADPTPAPASTPAPAPVPAAGPEAKPTITFDEFAKVDLRVAKVLKCEPHPNADKLFKLQLDDGSGTPRQICAGIRQAYTPEELVGKTIIIVANLAPRMLRGEESRGMLLAASNAPKDAAGVDRKVVVLTTLTDMPPGSIVS